MPDFEEGSVRTANAQLQNPTTKEFTYDCELYLGANKAASATASITIPAGMQGTVNFPITIPGEGVYPVYLDVYVGGILLVHFQATDDVTSVVTPDVVVGPITWV